MFNGEDQLGDQDSPVVDDEPAISIFAAGSCPVDPSLTPTSGLAATPRSQARNHPDSYVQNFSLSVQQQLPASFVGTISYVGAKGNRLFVSAEKQHTIEVFDLKTGEHIQTGTGVVKTPHMLAFVPDKNELFVADGGDGSCLVLDGADLHLIKRIPLEAGPDAGIYDTQTRIFYVGNGGRGAKTDYSYLSEMSRTTWNRWLSTTRPISSM